MGNILVGRYKTPNEYLGWIEPEDLSWILFVRKDHTVEVYLERDQETGEIIFKD